MRRFLLNAVTCLLPFALYTVCPRVASAQPVVTAAVTTAAAPLTCPNLPPAQTTFQASDVTAWFDFVYTGGTSGDQFQVQWFQPNGSSFATDMLTQPNSGGQWCYEYNIPILGHTAAGLPGTWTVKLIWNGNQIYSTSFTISAQPPLSDNFTQDSSLNTTLWSYGTSLMKDVAANFYAGPVTLETPSLSFSGTGMTMKGTTGAGQLTGVQSNQSFTPPFSAQLTVTGTVANGNPFYVQLISADLSQYLVISGNINPNNTGFYGINLNVDGTDSVLYATPAVNVQYTIAITVGVAGNAKVVLTDAAGTVLGTEDNLAIGADALYLVLGQFEGSPASVGPNTGIWQQVSVTPPAAPSGHPAFFSGEDSLGGGVYYLAFPDTNLFGYYNYQSSSILYHYDMGFEAFIPGTGSDVYLYDFTSGHWWYTSSALFPYLYDFTLNAWIYYFPSTTSQGHYTSNPRYFSNLTTKTIFTM
jgi:hypothetical protein